MEVYAFMQRGFFSFLSTGIAIERSLGSSWQVYLRDYFSV
jgi:hypothetical protein